MWIILLDHSGSMGDPFQGEAEFAGRVRESNALTKLESAKQALLTDLASLGTSTRIAIIAFTDQVSLRYEGLSGQMEEIRAELDRLQPNDGTDIANALDFAVKYVAGVTELRGPRQVLVISDGLSDLDAARTAAERLVEAASGAIHAILIDPTEEGEQLARAIAIGGRVDAVTSPGELRAGVAAGAREELKASDDPALVVAGFRREAELVTRQVAPEERVAFTAAYPGLVSPAQWYSLLVYCHTVRLNDAVVNLIAHHRDELGVIPATSTVGAQLSRGMLLRLAPQLDGVLFNPAQQEITWLEDIQEASFRLLAQPALAGHVLLGAIEIYAGPVLIAQLPLSVRVRAPSEPSEDEEYETVKGRTFETIFASYAHVDGDIVDACAEVYRALGIYMLIDRTALASGENWRDKIAALIQDADLFQLYWSRASKGSPEVAKEWREALDLQSRKGDLFIRPLYWEQPLPEPPSDLRHLHFARLDLGALAGSVGQSPRASLPLVRPPGVGVHTLAAVVPLVSRPSPETIAQIRQDAGFAVRFLEETTGLRYYPAPTLLVDDYLVETVRRLEVAAVSSVPESLKAEAKALVDTVGAILLTLNVRGFRSDLGQEAFEEAFGRGRVLSGEQWDEVLWQCEGASHYLRLAIEEPLNPAWMRMRDALSARGVPGAETRLDLAATVVAFLETVGGILAAGGQTLGDFSSTLKCGIPFSSWEHVRGSVPIGLVDARPADWSQPGGEQVVLLTGLFSGILRLFHSAASRLTEILQGSGPPIVNLVAEVATHGIYAPPDASAVDDALQRWALERNIIPALTLPAAPRILLSADAQRRFEERVRSHTPAGIDHHALAVSFRRAVLVHEHFHAAVQTGLDADGTAALGVDARDAWAEAMPLNESLAVWLELHLARDDLVLSELVWGYIRGGSYPAWPYRGAEWIEDRFQVRGMDAVRSLIARLRNDPRSAMAESLMAAT